MSPPKYYPQHHITLSIVSVSRVWVRDSEIHFCRDISNNYKSVPRNRNNQNIPLNANVHTHTFTVCTLENASMGVCSQEFVLLSFGIDISVMNFARIYEEMNAWINRTCSGGCFTFCGIHLAENVDIWMTGLAQHNILLLNPIVQCPLWHCPTPMWWKCTMDS